VGVLTRRDLLGNEAPEEAPLGRLVRRPPVTITFDSTLRMAADQMVNFDVGRLPVIDRDAPGAVIGIVTRSDLLYAHRRRLRDVHKAERSIHLSRLRPKQRRRKLQEATVAAMTKES
jgi:predicted transcriptional regulator